MSNPKQTKRLTPASVEALLTLLETLPGALFLLDEADTIVYANARAQVITGSPSEAFVGTTFWGCAAPLASPSLYQAVQKAKQSREATEVAYIAPVTNSWLHVSLSPTDDGLALFFLEQREPPLYQGALRPNEQRDRDLLEIVSDSVTVVTLGGLILDINQRPLGYASLRHEELIGKPFTSLPVWSHDPAVQEQLHAAIEQVSQGKIVHFEARIHLQEGGYLDIAVTMTPYLDADGQVESLIYTARDITARKRAEAEIYALIDTIPHFVWIMRPDGSCDYFNHQWCDYTQMTVEHVQRDGWIQCLHPDDQPHVLAAWQRAIQTGTPCEVEYRLRNGRTGAYRWFLARSLPHKDAQGTILQWVGTLTDIDDRKRVEQRLKESEESFRMLAETVPQLVWTTRSDGCVDYCNQRYCEYTHATFEQLQGYRWRAFLHPEDAQRIVTQRQHTLEAGEPFESEHRLRNSLMGTYHWFLTRAMPMRDETGQIIKWFGTSTDIDEQKRAAQQLKEGEENWRGLAEALPQLVWTARPDGRVEYANQRACAYTGAFPECILDEEWRQFVHPDDYERVQASRRHALETGQSCEIEYRLKERQTGAYRWFLVRALPVRDETGLVVKWFGTLTDIDEQKRTEAALRESQEQAHVLMSSNIIGIFLTNEEQIVDANDTFLHMVGYTRKELRDGRMNWMHMTPPEYLARTLQAHQELAGQQSMAPYEKEYVCKDGSSLPVLVGGVVLQTNSHQVINFALDNSARQELEQRKDDFINMASHELRNPLSALKMQTQLVRRRLERQSHHEAARALAGVEGPIRQLERLIGELLDISKIQAGRLEYQQEMVDLDALLRESADTMQYIYPSHRLVVRGAAQARLCGDRDRLGQVFTNLISNAIKYSPDAETVEIDLDASPKMVTIRVQDHGVGIPQERRDKIFERFYRVVDPKKRAAIPGLGMGLCIVAEIVKHYGGIITVDSTVGKGSTFTVTFPLARAALA